MDVLRLYHQIVPILAALFGHEVKIICSSMCITHVLASIVIVMVILWRER